MSVKFWGTLGMTGRDFERDDHSFEGERLCSQTVF